MKYDQTKAVTLLFDETIQRASKMRLVGEVQGAVVPHHEHVRCRLGFWKTIHIPMHSLDVAEHRNVGHHHLLHGERQGQHYAHANANRETHRQRDHDRHRKDDGLDPILFPKCGGVAHIHQPSDGDHHNGGEHGVGQVIKERGQGKQRQGDDCCSNPRGDRGFASRLFRDGCPRKPTCGGVTLEQRAEDVGEAEGAQLLVGIHPVAVTLLDGFGDADGLHKRHKRKGQRCGEQLLGISHAP